MISTDPTATHLPVDVNAAVLQKVVDYLNFHQGVDSGMPEKPLRPGWADQSSWDVKFIAEAASPRQQLYDIILVGATFFSVMLSISC